MARALIIGGTKGLGLELAIQAHRYDVRPIIVGRSASKLRQAALPELAGADYVDIDISAYGKPSELEELRRSTLKPLGRIQAALVGDRLRYVFWCAGAWLQGRFEEHDDRDVQDMVDLHFRGPIALLSDLHVNLRPQDGEEPTEGRHPRAYHLVTISSTAAWRAKEGEAVYGALKAAKSQFTRGFAKELARALPGSKATVVHPGGMRTENFWAHTGKDTTSFMDPAEVARIIWERARAQRASFHEYSIIRSADGSPSLKIGPQPPE